MGMVNIISDLSFSEKNIGKINFVKDTPVISISLNKGEKKGNTIVINVVYNPNDTNQKGVTWTSSNDNIASVTDGVVTIKDKADNSTVRITATSIYNSSVYSTIELAGLTYEIDLSVDYDSGVFNIQSTDDYIINNGLNLMSDSHENWTIMCMAKSSDTTPTTAFCRLFTFNDGSDSIIYSRNNDLSSSEGQEVYKLTQMSKWGLNSATSWATNNFTTNIYGSVAIRRKGSIIQWTKDGSLWDELAIANYNKEDNVGFLSFGCDTNTATKGKLLNGKIRFKIMYSSGTDSDVQKFFSELSILD